jgi:hypothetical protein
MRAFSAFQAAATTCDAPLVRRRRRRGRCVGASRLRFERSREPADALLLGRVTFEQIRGSWPLATTSQR